MVLLNISNIPKHRLVLGKIKENNQNKYINAIILNSTILTRKSSDDIVNGVQTNILNKSIDSDKLKHTIILSCILSSDTGRIPNLTLTQQNIHNNLVHIFKNNNINNSRIIFRNYSQINNIHNNNQYLVDDEDVNVSNIISDYNVFNFVQTTQDNYADNQFYINYYDRYNSTDYYNIDVSSILLNSTIENITLNNISINNIYNQDNSNILLDSNSLKLLYTISNEILDNTNIYTSGSNITKNKFDKLLLFAKPDISTSINLSYNTSNIIINSVLLNNYNRYNNRHDHSSKIIFYRDNSINIINCTSFGISTTSTKASNFIINNPNIVFLSLGNFSTGLTIQNIKNNISGKNGKFYFINNITEDLNYLISEDYMTSYANLYQNLNIGEIEKNNKQKTVSINNIFDICFNNSLLKNIEFENNVLYKDISNYISYNVDTVNTINLNNRNSIYSIGNTENPDNINLVQNLLGNNILDHSIFFNFRLNYNIGFTSTQYYGIRYYNNSSSTNYSILPISVISDFYVISGGDFQNIGCIFTYYNPEREETPDIYKYPYNNIDICSNPVIDNFEKAIEVLPGQRTQFSNSVFIPNKNGSNLSRKHIQGLIGLNNIPKLLSIKPYDPDFIIGRESTNLDDCITQDQQIQRKINAMKYKNNDFNNNNNSNNSNNNNNNNNNNNTSNNPRRQFARLINNRAINRSKLSCPVNYEKLGNNIYTPFKIYKSR